jgi:Flp pilus assembly protein CpaB
MSAAPPPPNRNPTYLIIAGIVVSLAGAIMVFLLVTQPSNISVIPGANHPVVIAAHAIDGHAQVSANDLQVVQYPASLVPEHALTSVSQANGRFAVAGIPKGQALTDDLLAGTAQAAQASNQVGIPTGTVAVVIPPSDARTLVAGLVQNGDRVDVLVSGLPGQTPGQVATTFTNLTIQVQSGGVPTAGGGQWVTYLPLKQAEDLVYLLNNGRYTFVVRSQKDTGTETPPAPVDRPGFNSTYGIH